MGWPALIAVDPYESGEVETRLRSVADDLGTQPDPLRMGLSLLLDALLLEAGPAAVAAEVAELLERVDLPASSGREEQLEDALARIRTRIAAFDTGRPERPTSHPGEFLG